MDARKRVPFSGEAELFGKPHLIAEKADMGGAGETGENPCGRDGDGGKLTT